VTDDAGAVIAAPGRRLEAIDVARGLALFGMMAVHVSSAGPGAAGFVHSLGGGRSAALFAVLAGVGLALGSGASSPDPQRLPRARRAVLVRCAVIAAIGLTLGLTTTPIAIILVYYAVLFPLAIPVLSWSPGRLFVAAGVWALLSPVVSQILRLLLEPDGPGDNPSWLSLTEPGETIAHLLLSGYYPVLTWTTYLLAGLAVGRLTLTSRRTGMRLALVGGGLALGAWLVSLVAVSLAGGEGALAATLPPGAVVGGRGEGLLDDSFFGTTPTTSWWFLGVMAPHSGAIPDLVHTTGTALLVIGAALMLIPPGARGRLRPLAAAGSMTLTLYCLHVVGLGLLDAADPNGRAGVWPVLVVNVVVATALALVWGSPARRGPLEEVVAATVDAGRR
jgi:uncharacterized membrane protein